MQDQHRKRKRGLVKRFSAGHCEMCLRSHSEVERAGHYMTVHHVTPFAEGGSDERPNLWIVCNVCHSLIHWVRNGYGFNHDPSGGHHARP
jgi:5-methylcytosine-specific restriction endonuclease McrA